MSFMIQKTFKIFAVFMSTIKESKCKLSNMAYFIQKSDFFYFNKVN